MEENPYAPPSIEREVGRQPATLLKLIVTVVCSAVFVAVFGAFLMLRDYLWWTK